MLSSKITASSKRESTPSKDSELSQEHDARSKPFPRSLQQRTSEGREQPEGRAIHIDDLVEVSELEQNSHWLVFSTIDGLANTAICIAVSRVFMACGLSRNYGAKVSKEEPYHPILAILL